jgi:hypothetical protein
MNLYKYLPKERLIQFKEKGIVHLSTLSWLRAYEMVDIGDKLEGVRSFGISKDASPVALTGEEFGKILPELGTSQYRNVKIVLTNGATLVEKKDAYVFCTTAKRNDKYWASPPFCYDAHYTIINPQKFAEALDAVLYRTVGGFKIDKVKYLEKKPELLSEKNKRSFLKRYPRDFWASFFEKDKKFMKQQEYRMVFARAFSSANIKPLTVSCPVSLKYCRF